MTEPGTSPEVPDLPADVEPDETVPLDHPAEGVPDVIASERGLDECADALRGGWGPIAIDAERASGHRYGQKAYLVQLRRIDAGTWLIDPIACPDLTPINDAIGGAEWILHAATQDLACLAEVGLRPRQLFDTELAGRLLGLPRVGLAAVVQHYLGLSLAKEHSAVDWSTRPLPEPWLRYAALDVEVLTDLRNLMGVDLERQGKSEWARQEFEHLLSWAPAERTDPWRRLSGLSSLRSARDVALARELWFERDRIARERDVSPARVVPDKALVDIVAAHPKNMSQLPTSHRAIARYGKSWIAALARGKALADNELPPRTIRSDGPPPARSWTDKDPVAAARLTATREELTAFADDHSLPIENVCSPDPLRRVVWSPPKDLTIPSFEQALLDQGCRRWQAAIVAPMLSDAFAAHPS